MAKLIKIILKLITLTAVEVIFIDGLNAMVNTSEINQYRRDEVGMVKISEEKAKEEALSGTKGQEYFKISSTTNLGSEPNGLIVGAIRTKRNKEGVSTSNSIDEVEFNKKARSDGYRLSDPKESPYAVFLFFTYPAESINNASMCSGSLITLEWVLTAAHCMYASGPTVPVSETRIIAGASAPANVIRGIPPAETKAQTLLAEDLRPHPRFDPNKLISQAITSDEDKSTIQNEQFDIMLVKTKEPFKPTKYVGAIGLSMNPWEHQGYKECTVVGFGYVYPDKKVSHEDNFKRKTHNLKMKKPCACSWKFAYAVKRFTCAEPREDYGVCTGDSGAGLVCDGKIWATTESTMLVNPFRFCQSDTASSQCGSKKGVQIFVDICAHLKWISSYVQIVSKISGKCLDFTESPEELNKLLEGEISCGPVVQYSPLYFLSSTLIFTIL